MVARMGHSSFTFTTDGFARNLESRQDVVSHDHRGRIPGVRGGGYWRSRLWDGTEDRQADRPGGWGCGVFKRIAKWPVPHTGESGGLPLNWNRTLPKFMLYLERTFCSDFLIPRKAKETPVTLQDLSSSLMRILRAGSIICARLSANLKASGDA